MFDRLFDLLRPAPSDPRAIFAGQMATVVRGVEGVAAVEVSTGDFSLHITSREGIRTRLRLAKIFVETRAMSPHDRTSRLAEIAELMRPPRSTTWDEARATLVPLLRPSVYLAGTPLDDETSRYPFAPFVHIWVATDDGGRFGVVGQKQMAAWGADETAFIEAMNAREAELVDVAIACEETPHGKLFRVDAKDGNDSGRLAFDGFLRSFRGKVEGAPIAIIPRPDLLLIGGDARAEMVAALVDRARGEYLAAPRPLSPVLYAEDETNEGARSVSPYVWPHGGPLTVATQGLQADLAQASYAAQARTLEARLIRSGKDIVVAKVDRLEAADGAPRLVATWKKGVHTWLPAVEEIALVGWDPQNEGASVLVPFAEIEARLRLLELSPARYEAVDAYPSLEEIAAWRRRFAKPETSA